MYFIKPCNITSSTVALSPSASFVQQLNKEKTNWSIKFGVKTLKVEVIFSNSLENNQIVLSNNIIDDLRIPLTCFYDILIKENEIVIGPFIGILSELTNKKVAEMLPTYSSFVKGYKKICGAIIVFSLEGISLDNYSTLSGFLYQPDTDSWVFGIFPYPAAIMSILEASLTPKWEEFRYKMKHFISILGPKVFNFPHFSKWEMYNLLVPKLGNVLPKTTLYKDVEDIAEMLHIYGSVYIKPLNGRLGKQIYKVIKDDPKIVVQYDHEREKQVRYFTNDPDIIAFFKKHLVPGMFLIQQTIPLMVYQNSVLDFRVMVVKNEFGLWENLGMYARYGAKGQIVSNITAGGKTEIADSTLKKVWKLTNEEIVKVKAAIGRVIRESLFHLEQNGYHIGNIGFDIGLDKKCSIYIIEINHQNPDPYIAVFANNRDAFYLARLKNMMYAKHLVGF